MPELPEVEVVKRSLESKIQNLIIKFSIFLSKDLLTTSTSGNSGI